MNPKVSIIISNRNDIAMLTVTVRSCIEELRPLGKGGGEIIIVDNSDKDAYRSLGSALPMGYAREKILRIYRQEFPCLFSARELAVEKAIGDYIICLDSHMLVGRNMIKKLVSFMDRQNGNNVVGFAHAPISWAHHHESHARHDRDVSVSELGPWGGVHKVEKKMTWKGMPWICRREWFLDQGEGLGGYGALAKHRVSWGGGDMHIGVKSWLLGFQNWAVPCNPGIHIGPFPKKGDKSGKTASMTDDVNDYEKYRRYSVSGNFPHTFGFLVSCYVLGGEPMMARNKEILRNRFGCYIDSDKWWTKAIEIGEEEKRWLDSRKVMTFEEFLEKKPWLN